jgi:ABC-type histidine transport system ATPase subunit
MLWTLDVGGFRQMLNQFESTKDAHEAVLFAALNQDSISKIQEMAIVKAEGRASAAQMLVKCYNRVGLSTPRNQVPALTSSPPSTIAAARALALAPPALTTRTAQTKPRVQKNANIFTVAA